MSKAVLCHKLGESIFVGNFFRRVSRMLRKFQADKSGTLLDKSGIDNCSRSSQRSNKQERVKKILHG